MRKSTKDITVGYGEVTPVKIGHGYPLVLIAGPCAIESYDHTFLIAGLISKICKKLGIPWIYKSCYDKDCRSSAESFHGIGLAEGLEILTAVRQEFNVPVVSDFSNATWAKETGQVCDLIQVPAYLCRQSSILKAAAETGRPVHLKKAQFISPWNIKNSVRKLELFGCKQILITDRGTFFGYNQLVNDMTCFPIMKKTGYPVCFDATHSIQLPTSMGNISGGQREFIPCLVRSAVACGINALFMEVHDKPSQALSDPNTVLDIQYLEIILKQSQEIHNLRLKQLKTYGEDNVHTKE